MQTIASIVDGELISSRAITRGVSIAAIASGVGLSIGTTSSGTSWLFSLATAITPNSFKTFTIKQEKHDTIKLQTMHFTDNAGLRHLIR